MHAVVVSSYFYPMENIVKKRRNNNNKKNVTFVTITWRCLGLWTHENKKEKETEQITLFWKIRINNLRLPSKDHVCVNPPDVTFCSLISCSTPKAKDNQPGQDHFFYNISKQTHLRQTKKIFKLQKILELTINKTYVIWRFDKACSK